MRSRSNRLVWMSSLPTSTKEEVLLLSSTLLLRDHLKRSLNQLILLRFNQTLPQPLPLRRHNQPPSPSRSQQLLSPKPLPPRRRKRRKHQRKKLPNQRQPLPVSQALTGLRPPQRSLLVQLPRSELFTEGEKPEPRSLRRELP